MRSLGTAYLLAAFSFVFFAGLHRFYLGKPLTGLLWFMTGGLLGLGTIYDLITLPEQVADANRKALGTGGHTIHLHPSALPAAAPAQPAMSLELRMLHLARRNQGRLSVIKAATELGVPLDEAEKQLDEFAANGHAEIEVSDEGTIIYDFPTARA